MGWVQGKLPGAITQIARLAYRSAVPAASRSPLGRVLGAVAVGGALGSLGRWGISLVLGPWEGSGIPLSTLIVNLLGCLAIGVLASLPRLQGGPTWLRPFLINGVLGGFTTFSALALEVGVLAEGGQAIAGTAYLLLTVAGGVAAVALGRVLAGNR